MEQRCTWSGNDPLMIQYHDEEWGVPVHDDRKHFEFLVLEGAQAGLSWSTVLKKREGYRKAFAQFDWNKVAKFTEKDVVRLIANPEIIRNRLKIQSAITNAKAFIALRKEFGSFDKYIWSFVNNKPENHSIKTMKDVPAKTALSDRVSLDLKKRGFNFVGSTIIYAHLQATGIVNDHEIACFRHKEILRMKN